MEPDISLAIITDAHWVEVDRIQKRAYTSELHEDLDVLKSKSRAHNAICRIVEQNAANKAKVIAYILAHPWVPMNTPALNQKINLLSIEDSTHLFIHDFAFDPSVQGKGYARQAIQELECLALAKGFKSIGLVAVQQSAAFWAKFDFILSNIEKPLDTYDEYAVFMSKHL